MSYRAFLRSIPIRGFEIDWIKKSRSWRDEFVLFHFYSLIRFAPLVRAGSVLLPNHIFSNAFNEKTTRRASPFYDLILEDLSTTQGHMEGTFLTDGPSNRAFLAIDWASTIGHEYTVEDDKKWRAISLDATALERGIDLSAQPLWLDDTPDWAIRGWETLATELTKRAPYWRTLVRWYEDRLHGDDWAASQGRPAIPELEIARASLPDSYWKKGGKAVNEAIAKLEDYFWNGVEIDDPVLRELVGQTGDAGPDEVPGWVPYDYSGDPPPEPLISPPPVEAVPEQTSAAIRFDGLSANPIDLAPPTASDHMSDTPGRREDYAELREKARDLMAQGVNRLGRIKQPLDRFLALDDDLARVRAPIFWSRINTFRIDLADHDNALTRTTLASEPDERILDSIVAGKLRDVVQTVNLYVAGDPLLLGYDAQRLGPREALAEIATIKRTAPILKVALSNTVITVRDAGEIVIEQVEIASSAPATVAGRLATDLGSKTVGNYVSTLVRRGYAPLKPYIDWSGKGITEGALREIGKQLLDGSLPGIGRTAREILVFISDNVQLLVQYASDHFGNPALQMILELIHKMLS